MKTIKKYQKGSEVKGSKGGKASQIIAGISAAAAGAAGIGKNISNRRKAKKAAQEKAKMEAAGKMQYGGNKKIQRPVPKPITIDQKYGILGDYGPKTEADTNMLKFIDNAGKTPIPGKQKGGATKKTLMKAQDGKIIKSKKVRTASMNTFGPSTANVSKTKRDGSTVTKSVNTNRGYVPFASKTKSITDASGNTTSSTKDMDWNKAVKKQYRMAKRVGRNPNDEITINQKGGATKLLKKAQYGTEFGKSTTKKGIFGRTKVATPETDKYRDGSTSKGISTNTYDSKGKYIKNKTKFTTTNPDGNSRTMVVKRKKGQNNTFGNSRRGIIPVKKTGGMVNSNTKVSASKIAKGRTGGTSSAPKTATPKAKMGGSMKKKSC
jgi:hypothetical protein